MKNSLILLALLFCSSFAIAQPLKETEVPEKVKAACKQQFPKSKVKKWEKEGDKFEAELILQRVESSVVFNAAGEVLETETEIKTSELPATIIQYVTAKHQGYKVKEAAKILHTSGEVNYEAEVNNMVYIFTSQGSLITSYTQTETDKD